MKYLGLDAQFELVDLLKQKIDSFRPFTSEVIRTLREKLIVEWTYNSNAIEGNTLTMSETKVVLEGVTIGGKTIVEHLEAINHRDAIELIESLVSRRESLTEVNIRAIHSLILKGIDGKNAGAYRSQNVLISGAKHTPPKHFEISILMRQFIEEYSHSWLNYHPVVRATLLHGEFVKIHPFIDGNGRTARLLLNFELLRNNYAPIIIKNENRAKYYEALDVAHTTLNYGAFLTLVVDSLLEEERLWLSVME